MDKKKIDTNQLVRLAKIYEKSKKYDYHSDLDANYNIMKFTGKLRAKLVIVSCHSFPAVQIEKVLPAIVAKLQTDDSLSATIDFVCTTQVSNQTRGKMTDICEEEGLNVNVIDINDLMEVDDVRKDVVRDEDVSKYEKVAFDYLSKSNDSSFIQNGLYYSQILFAIYQKPSLTVDTLQLTLSEKVGRQLDGLDNDITFLRRIKKIEPQQKNNKTLVLTEEEYTRIQEAVKESQAIESEFMKEFEQISQQTGIKDIGKAFDSLQKFYASRCRSLYETDGSKSIDENQNNDYDLYRNELADNCSNERNIDSYIGHIMDLCSRNGYMNKINMMRSFINLYKSNKYQEYIGNKVNVVMLDTPVLINLLCAYSPLNKEIDVPYEDEDFKAVDNLRRLREHSKNVVFMLPYDYASEVIGELKKAIQISLFDDFVSDVLPLQTSNTLYNYYLHVRKYLTKDTVEMTFQSFAKKIGFANLNADSSRFYYENQAFLRQLFETTKDIYLDKELITIENYDAIKNSYSTYLYEERKYSKSARAIDADIRQSYYLLNTQETNKEYYVTSWDSTLYKLREIVKEKTNSHTNYSIHRPSALTNRISLKSFKMNAACFTNDIFTYADRSFSLAEKIRNLFDHVLIPYFNAIKGNNIELVNKVIELQKKSIDEIDEGQSSQRNSRLPLETLFINIEEEMRKSGCSQNDLRDFLSDTENNDYFVALIQQTFVQDSEHGICMKAKQFCKKLMRFISQKDEECISTPMMEQVSEDVGVRGTGTLIQ